MPTCVKGNIWSSLNQCSLLVHGDHGMPRQHTVEDVFTLGVAKGLFPSEVLIGFG